MDKRIIYIIIAIIVIIVVAGIIYLFIKKNKIKKTDIIEIIHEPTKNIGLDIYNVYKGNNKILTSNGTWNLKEKNLYFEINKEKINVNIISHKYNFKYKHNVVISGNNIIIDDYTDEIKILKENNKYRFVRNKTTLAEINYKDTNRAGERIYQLNIFKSENYIYIYLITFIILKQIEKDLNVSLD